MKSWTTRKGARRRGSFTLQTLRYLLLNPIYIGKIRLKGELHEGEHAPIIPMGLWQQVQEILGRTNRQAPRGPRQRQVAMLRGLLYCQACGTRMVPTYTSGKKQRFRYYTCLSAQKRGRKTCPTRSLAAEEIERSVLERINPFLRSGEFAAAEVQARYEADPWDDLISEWVNDPTRRSDQGSIAPLTSTPESVTVRDILIHCIGKGPDAWVQADQTRVARSLTAMGWKRYQKRIPDGREWRYKSPVAPLEPR